MWMSTADRSRNRALVKTKRHKALLRVPASFQATLIPKSLGVERKPHQIEICLCATVQSHHFDNHFDKSL